MNQFNLSQKRNIEINHLQFDILESCDLPAEQCHHQVVKFVLLAQLRQQLLRDLPGEKGLLVLELQLALGGVGVGGIARHGFAQDTKVVAYIVKGGFLNNGNFHGIPMQLVQTSFQDISFTIRLFIIFTHPQSNLLRQIQVLSKMPILGRSQNQKLTLNN